MDFLHVCTLPSFHTEVDSKVGKYINKIRATVIVRLNLLWPPKKTNLQYHKYKLSILTRNKHPVDISVIIVTECAGIKV